MKRAGPISRVARFAEITVQPGITGASPSVAKLCKQLATSKRMNRVILFSLLCFFSALFSVLCSFLV